MKNEISGFLRNFAVAGVLALTGCVHDVSHDARYPSDYVVGGTYRTVQSLVATIDDRGAFTLLHKIKLTPQMARLKARLQPQFPEVDVPQGSLVQLEKLELVNSFEMGKLIWVRGRFFRGIYADKKVELYFVSKKTKTHPEVPQVDTNCLQLAKEPSK